VSLGTTWSLVSRHTSFVAVEERATPTQGDAQLRKVPVAITRGWHGIGFGHGRPQAAAYSVMCASAPARLGGDEQAALNEPMVFHDTIEEFDASPALDSRRSRAGQLMRSVQALRPATSPSLRPLDRLVALQGADGSWKLTKELAQALGWPDAKRLKKALGRPLSGEAEERAAATALALAWLERECADARDEWRMLADKGREWLSRTPEGIDAWLALAGEALARR
jgi:hypothetical protein